MLNKQTFRATLFSLLSILLIFPAEKSLAQWQKMMSYSSTGTGNELQFPAFKVVLSPNISIWMPTGGDDGKTYAPSFKYGVKVMFKPTERLLVEIGYSSSSIRVKEDYIRDLVRDNFGEEITDLKESSGGNVTQFLGGIRLLLQSKGKSMPYFRIGASNYKRGNITASYSGRGRGYTSEMDLKIYTEESGSSLYAGFGVMILLGSQVALDLQANGNLILLEDEKPFWLEPAIGLNILL